MNFTEEQLQQMAEEYANPARLEKLPLSVRSQMNYCAENFIAGFKKCRELLGQDSVTNDRLKVALNTCKNDYWFMINLLERYSTDKDQAIKDCLERMKFRQPMFDAAMKESG